MKGAKLPPPSSAKSSPSRSPYPHNTLPHPPPSFVMQEQVKTVPIFVLGLEQPPYVSYPMEYPYGKMVSDIVRWFFQVKLLYVWICSNGQKSEDMDDLEISEAHVLADSGNDVTVHAGAAFQALDVVSICSLMRQDLKYTDLVLFNGSDEQECEEFPFNGSDEQECEEFPCHRVVLALTSPVFNRMFSAGWQETEQKRVKISGKSREVVKLFLDCIYTGSLPVETATATAIDLLDLGCMYEIHQVIQVATFKLQRSVRIDCARDIIEALHKRRTTHPCVEHGLRWVLKCLREGGDTLMLAALFGPSVDPPSVT